MSMSGFRHDRRLGYVPCTDERAVVQPLKRGETASKQDSTTRFFSAAQHHDRKHVLITRVLTASSSITTWITSCTQREERTWPPLHYCSSIIMARAGRSNSRPTKPRPSASSSKANALGYAKRHAKKAETTPLLEDVYEYAQEKKGRSREGVRLELDRGEEAGYRFGEEEEGIAEDVRGRVKLLGEDERIGSEDDEEIDSDEAFEEEDEERFAGFFSSRGKNRKNVQKKTKRNPAARVRFADVEVNLDEDEDEDMQTSDADAGSGDSEEDEEEEDGDGEEFYDVLDVLDGRAELDNEDDGGDASKPASNKRDSGSSLTAARGHNQEVSDDDDDDDEEDEENLAFSPSDAEDDAEPSAALDALQTFVSSLDPAASAKKRPASDADAAGEREPKKQRRLKERTEAGAENEFRAQTSGAKLNLDDLLAPLSSSSAPQSSALQALKQAAKALGPASSASTKSKVPQTLAAPLPVRAQERLDRAAAYAQTKEEVERWSGTMKCIREAEHLSFPLQAPSQGRVSNLELAAKFKPTTALETSVAALLASAKLRDEDLPHTEESMLQANNISVEEVAARRAELRRTRELLFRAEVKARRVAKIKSRTYRKLRRKERERLGGGEEGEGEGEGGEGEEERMKREVERARERATLRHKHTGKWARRMRGREGEGEEGRREVEEMLERGEKLRRRIRGVGSDEEEESHEEESEGGEEGEEGVERIKRDAFDELRRVQVQAEDEDEGERGGKGKGKSIFEMKFMKDAMARQQLAVDRMADDFVKELGGHLENEENESDDADEPQAAHEVDPESGVVTQRTGGRVSYHPGASNNNLKRPAARPSGSLASDTSSVTLKSTDLLTPPPQSPLSFQRPSVPLPAAESNPWLARNADPENPTVKAPKKTNEVVVGKESSAMTKSKNKMKKLARKSAGEKEKAVDDALVEIEVGKVLTVGEGEPAKLKSAPKPKKKTAAAVGGGQEDDEEEVNSEVEEQEKALERKAKGKATATPHAFQQRDLVALAFAGDNVVHEFEEAKKREIAADAPREVDTTIPGWGSWGGAGVRRAAPKPERIKKIAGVDPTTRADYGKAHVIISEKRDKKAAKYLVKDLPYPYTSKAQFEKTMQQPLGTEWNTRVAFQRGTLPRVVKKPGVVIDPLEKLGS
ncbi:putative utp14 protein [Lyophyllum shimeji]|uniref:Utp14 protein n=1 Tax=Lyophyllum shimeji TaxID=47721 RepID=A0A9P3PY76_LYOSH|nr:putative utp14 protein [Lyophyllum shimeji]